MYMDILYMDGYFIKKKKKKVVWCFVPREVCGGYVTGVFLRAASRYLFRFFFFP